MKKNLIAGLLVLTLFLPSQIGAAENSATKTLELSAASQKKKKAKSRKGKVKKTVQKGCTYNGYSLFVGPRGGCYYYSGNSKEYVDRSYCRSCN